MSNIQERLEYAMAMLKVKRYDIDWIEIGKRIKIKYVKHDNTVMEIHVEYNNEKEVKWRIVYNTNCTGWEIIVVSGCANGKENE